MITKSDWEAVRDQLMAEERRRLGEPPTFEQLSAYMRGELSAAEEERMRDLLACYPELARAIAEPFPEEDAVADREVMSDEELESRWVELEGRINGARAGVLRFPLAWTALAASLLLVFGGVYWNTVRLRPQIVPASAAVGFEELRNRPTRGGRTTPVLLTATDEEYRIAATIPNTVEQTSFRIGIVDAQHDKLWQSEIVKQPDHSIAVKIPTKFLDPGSYDIELIGVDGAGKEEKLARYPIEVPGT